MSALRVLDNEPEQGKVVYEMTPAQIEYILAAHESRVLEKVQNLLRLETEKPMGTKEAATFLNIKPEALTVRVHRKMVPFHKNGGTLYFYASELNKEIKKR